MNKYVYLLCILFIVFASKVLSTDVPKSHKKVELKNREVINLIYLDNEKMTLIIPQIFWRKFLAKLTGIPVNKHLLYEKLNKKIYSDGVIDLRKLNTINLQNITSLKNYINHFRIVPLSYKDLGYLSFDSFVNKNFKCIYADKKHVELKIISSEALLSPQLGAYIMRTNGAVLRSSSYYGNLNLTYQFSSKVFKINLDKFCLNAKKL